VFVSIKYLRLTVFVVKPGQPSALDQRRVLRLGSHCADTNA